ncbi:MAG: hypothetical protein HGA96_01845 [Desulfobulbaceae bacterium]|nr:hypothetical protein [Desulfobulbaceae bacterium]
MLDYLRKKSQSTVIQVTIVAIVLVFIFWGVGSRDGNEAVSLATVNGEKISFLDYQRLYDQKLNQLRDQLGGEIPSGLLDSLGLKAQVVDELVRRTLVRQGALASGLSVSDDEVRQAIQEMPAFKNKDSFDAEWYKGILANNRMSVSDFENSVRDDLLTAKVLGHFSRFGGVSETELKDRFEFDYRQKGFAFAAFPSVDFEKRVIASDKDLAAFFESHKDNYLGQPELNLKYVLFPFDGSGSAPVTDAEVTDYYERHQDEFSTAETRRARHILIRAAASDSPATVSAKQARAGALLKEAQAGADFAALAQKNSDDKGSASQGGDLGFFGRGQMVKTFEDGVFGLNKGGLTMVRSEFGFHIIKLEEVRLGKVRSLIEARDEIVAAVRKEGAKKQAYKTASEDYEKIILAGSLDKFAQSGGVTLKQTGLFSVDAPPEVIKAEPAFLRAVTALKKGELSSIVDGASAYAVFFALEVKPPSAPLLLRVRDRVQADYAKDKAVELAKESAGRFLAALKAGGNMASEAQKYGVQVAEAPMLSRADRAASQLPPAVLDAGLALTAANPYPQEAPKVEDTFFVLKYTSEKDASEELFRQKREELAKKLADENRSRLVVAWEAHLHDQAKIEINPAFAAKEVKPGEKSAPAK